MLNATKARLYHEKPPFTHVPNGHESSAPASQQKKPKAVQLRNSAWRTETVVGSDMSAQGCDNGGKQ
jgi:hypothetical protein